MQPIATLSQDFTMSGLGSGDVGKFVSLSADTTVVLSNGTVQELGILTDYDGATGTVVQLGNAYLVAGETLVAGDKVWTDTVGRGIKGGDRAEVLVGATVGNLALVSLTPVHQGMVRQTFQTNLAVNFSTASAAYVTALTANVTTQARGRLVLWGTMGGSVTGNASIGLRIQVDGATVGVPTRNHGHGGADSNAGVMTFARSAVLAAGAHTITLQTLVTAGRTWSVTPGANEGASIMGAEVIT